jgi:transposase-like protein
MEFVRDFPDDAACLEWLWRTRYSDDGEHAYCERCQQERTFKRYDTETRRQSWTCTACGLHVHPTAGTIFHKSSTSLHLWFYAMYLMTSTRCGISAKQVERELGVTYKTAWRMCKLIREDLMEQDDGPLSGDVEMDETYVGGKLRQSDKVRMQGMNPTQRRQEALRLAREKKTTVFGMVERGGQVSAHVVPDQPQREMMRHVRGRVLDASMIYTDDARMYDQLEGMGYQHRRINHSAKVYVSGDTHTQTIEGFWSLVKSGIRGAHHAVSAKHLQGYLNEYVWRYNHRGDRRAMFLSVILNSAQESRSLA